MLKMIQKFMELKISDRDLIYNHFLIRNLNNEYQQVRIVTLN